MPRTGVDATGYWQARPEQRLYVAFCLLMASVQDSLIGLREAEQQNHNWSATCSYYSLVHAGRLFAFVAVGDFPRSHASLSQLFVSLQQTGGEEHPTPIASPFDWLSNFTRGVNDAPETVPLPRMTDVADHIASYFIQTLDVPDAAPLLGRFGELIGRAKELRNDSNYEALLIAHEHFHSTMGPAFATLSRVLNAACHEFVVPFALRCFERMVVRDAAFASEAVYQSFAYHYVHRRLRQRVMPKVSSSEAAISKLETLLTCSVLRETGESSDRVDEAVSYRLFGPKRKLMESFNDSVNELERFVQVERRILFDA